ncbi:hypothetical protein ACW2Q0_02535 [Nocardia sp. R16R-3T]
MRLFVDYLAGFAVLHEVGLVKMGRHRIDAEGVFTHTVDDSGKITTLRAFCEVARTMATARPST